MCSTIVFFSQGVRGYSKKVGEKRRRGEWRVKISKVEKLIISRSQTSHVYLQQQQQKKKRGEDQTFCGVAWVCN